MLAENEPGFVNILQTIPEGPEIFVDPEVVDIPATLPIPDVEAPVRAAELRTLPNHPPVAVEAPVDGEAFGEDLVGDFHHHTGPFGAFGFYANFFDDGERIVVG